MTSIGSFIAANSIKACLLHFGNYYAFLLMVAYIVGWDTEKFRKHPHYRTKTFVLAPTSLKHRLSRLSTQSERKLQDNRFWDDFEILLSEVTKKGLYTLSDFKTITSNMIDCFAVSAATPACEISLKVHPMCMGLQFSVLRKDACQTNLL